MRNLMISVATAGLLVAVAGCSTSSPPQWAQGSESVDMSRAASPPGNMRRSSTIVVEPLIMRDAGSSGAVPRACRPITRC